jgi:hypothetical protein
MGGGAPGGQPIVVGLEDLMMLFSQIAEQQGGGGGAPEGEPGMEGPNEGAESATTNKQLGQRMDAIDEKLDMLLQALTGGVGMPGGEAGMPGGEAGMPPAGGEEIPPDLMAAMGGQMPPDVGGGMPMGEMGAGMPPEAMAGAPTPMLPAMTPMASSNDGMNKSAAMSISKLAAKLRR